MPTFLNQNKPIVTGMVLESTPDDMRFKVKNSIYAGADALGLQFERLKKEYKTEENYIKIIESAGGKPTYITNYRGFENLGMSDEECIEHIKLILKCGGTLADITGNFYDPDAPDELTYDKDAIKKQIKLIDEIHHMGKEVLMSSHINKFLSKEEVFKVAYEHKKRGADISKIVVWGGNEEEEIENFKISNYLKNELGIPFLLLSNGKYNKIMRMAGFAFGSSLCLAVESHDKNAVPSQPTIKAVRNVIDNFDYMPDLIY